MSYGAFIGTDSWNRGQKKECEFGVLLKRKYPEARSASFQEQVSHIDWICNKGAIDVKAMKRINRSGDIQSKVIWIEFKGNSGRKGWLYGKQDYVAFEAPDRFVLVKRADLQKLCEKICDTESRVDSAKDALYKIYTRKGKLDQISLIHFNDLFQIKNFSLKKIT